MPLLLAFLLLLHYPIIERRHDTDAILDLRDPTVQSVAVYGRLGTPDEVDLYRFSAANEQDIPVEALVPIRRGAEYFRPAIAFLSKDGPALDVPFDVPEGYGGVVILAPDGDRARSFDPVSLESMYRGTERRVHVKPGQVYYVAVFEPDYYMGDYSLSIGTVDDLRHASTGALIASILRTKFDLIAGDPVPWLDMCAFLVFIGGIVLGFHSLGRSRTWQLSALGVAGCGAVLLYRQSLMSGVATFQALAALVLLVVVLAMRQARVVPLVCWSAILFLLAWYVWV